MKPSQQRCFFHSKMRSKKFCMTHSFQITTGAALRTKTPKCHSWLKFIHSRFHHDVCQWSIEPQWQAERSKCIEGPINDLLSQRLLTHIFLYFKVLSKQQNEMRRLAASHSKVSTSFPLRIEAIRYHYALLMRSFYPTQELSRLLHALTKANEVGISSCQHFLFLSPR